VEDETSEKIKCNIKGKKSRLNLQKMTKVCHGTKEGFV
jgi:hypothetical protein